MQIQAAKGTKDIYGEEARIWQKLETMLRGIASTYCFGEIRTPIIEHTELFLRGVGDTTDIVEKEMYSFNDKGGRGLTLRPEQTAGVARAYIEHGMHSNAQPIKLYYIGPNFRYENPQAGRYRQHHQFGVEIFGVAGPSAELELISIGHEIIKALGISGVALNINSIGCANCRGAYKGLLKGFLGQNFEGLCGTCKTRFEKNPLRTLDCKVETCKKILMGAPSILDVLDDECSAHFSKLQEELTNIGVPYVVNPKIVRGLDYYTRTVFEFIDDNGSGLTIIGGGRYDGLIEEVGGPPTPGAGFGMGLERLALNMKKQGANDEHSDMGPALFVGNMGEAGHMAAKKIVYGLRQKGINAEYDLIGRSVKAQMKYADKIRAKFSMIIGESEIECGEAQIKNMAKSESVAIPINEIDKIYAYITD